MHTEVLRADVLGGIVRNEDETQPCRGRVVIIGGKLRKTEQRCTSYVKRDESMVLRVYMDYEGGIRQIVGEEAEDGTCVGTDASDCP